MSSRTQAKDAGVTVNVKNWTATLLRRPVPEAGVLRRLLGHPRLPQPGAAGLAPELAVQRDALAAEVGDGSNFEDLYKQALAATDEAARSEIMHEMQQLEYDIGGYIIPFFNNLIDGYAANVSGFCRARGRSTSTRSAMASAIWFA